MAQGVRGHQLSRRIAGFPNREPVYCEMPDRERLNARASDDQATYGEPSNGQSTDRQRTDCSRANRDRADGCRRECTMFGPVGQIGSHHNR
jgi:hypothetical protein